MSQKDYAIGRGVGERMADQWEQLYMKAQSERDCLRRQRDVLLTAANAAKKYLESDLVEPGRTVFWKLVEAIKDSEEQP